MREEIRLALHADGERETAALPDRRAEVDDDPIADLESTLDAAALERDQRELGEIAAALERLDSDDYGLCAECGEPIPWERLSVLPQALRCVDCESRVERAAGAPLHKL